MDWMLELRGPMAVLMWGLWLAFVLGASATIGAGAAVLLFRG